MGALDEKVLEAVKQSAKRIRELQTHLGLRIVLNDSGGFSAATTRTLERLRHHGLLRIARRDRGIRIYELARPHDLSLTSDERLRKFILIIAGILAPVPEKSLRSTVTRYRRWAILAPRWRHCFEPENWKGNPSTALLMSGRRRLTGKPLPICRGKSDFWHRSIHLVWDRRRFEHLWGWAYRFEAYTPTAKRIRGYYAMPMLWGDAVIGWANVRVHEDRLSIEPGFVSKPPRESLFRSELERETQSLRAFLNLGSTVSTSILWP